MVGVLRPDGVGSTIVGVNYRGLLGSCGSVTVQWTLITLGILTARYGGGILEAWEADNSRVGKLTV